MQKLITIIASALLLGYLVTEMSARFYADNYFALLVMSIAALIINGFFVTRVAAGAPAEPSSTQSQERPNKQNQNRKQPSRNNNKSKDRGEQRKERPNKSRQAQVPKGDAEEGEVKWFNRSKGYGFIIRPNEEEIFVHQRSIGTTQHQDVALTVFDARTRHDARRSIAALTPLFLLRLVLPNVLEELHFLALLSATTDHKQ